MRRLSPGLFAWAMLALATLSPAAQGGPPRPYKGALDFAVLDVQPVSATQVVVRGSLAGEETFLGRFRGEVVYLIDLSTGTFEGSLYKRAANRDLLYETPTGHFTATSSEGGLTILGGTGRFRHAAGSGTYVSVWTDPTQTALRVTFDGTISFDASDRP